MPPKEGCLAEPVKKITPNYDHVLHSEVRSRVYEPEADTFLLMDALDQDAAMLRGLSPATILEVGTGSGLVITHLARDILPAGSCFAFAVDVNPFAIATARETWQRNVVLTPPPALECIRGDLVTMLRGGRSSFDVVLFNPPYVPTSEEEIAKAHADHDFLQMAFSGGPKGRLVVDRFLLRLADVLSAGGLAYVIALEANEPEEMIHFAEEASGHRLTGSIVLSRYTGERLSVVRFQRR